ncbi:hypothetical protein NT05HA_1127 [Aggregatibacter aphrophilus NJ8700]|nr:hypothetical protein NT05HA_1127 [Aggregatibacter aphrophilus NJ8700]
MTKVSTSTDACAIGALKKCGQHSWCFKNAQHYVAKAQNGCRACRSIRFVRWRS